MCYIVIKSIMMCAGIKRKPPPAADTITTIDASCHKAYIYVAARIEAIHYFIHIRCVSDVSIGCAQQLSVCVLYVQLRTLRVCSPCHTQMNGTVRGLCQHITAITARRSRERALAYRMSAAAHLLCRTTTTTMTTASANGERPRR